MGIKITNGMLEGIRHIRPSMYMDDRGYFMESYNKRDFTEAGITDDFLQDNESRSTKGVLRGLHFQIKHTQAKLVRCIYGRVLDVAVDLRKSSPAYSKWEAVLLDGETRNMLYIPPGFAHGFMVVSDYAVFSYKCTDYYHPEYDGGIRWDDPDIGIDWKMEDYGICKPVLSDKDAALPYLRDLALEF